MITVTTTAVAFILLSFGLGFCGWRFFGSFQKGANNMTGFLVSSYYILYAFQTGVIGWGTLLTAPSGEGLYLILAIAGFILAFNTPYGVYVLSYLISLKNKNLWIFLASLLGISQFVLTIVFPHKPYVDVNNSIVWNAPVVVSISVFLSLAVSIGVFFFIFSKLYYYAKSSGVKMMAFVLATSSLLGIIANFVYLVLQVSSYLYGVTTAFIGVATFIFLWSLYLKTN